jgi:protein TonB
VNRVAGPDGGEGVRGETRRVKFLLLPEPEYPAALRARKVSGDVRVPVSFAADGSIQILEPIESPDAGLSAAALEAIRRIRFLPALRDGVKVEQTMIITAHFNLARRASGALSGY